MKEAVFLIAVQRIVGRVEVEHDLARRCLMRVQKQPHEQLLDRRSIMADLVIARRLACPRRMLQTVQGALARQKARRLAVALELAEQHAQNRIAAKVIVVVEVLIAQRQAEDALRDQSPERMDGHQPITAVGEASRKPIRQPDRLVRLAQQQRSAVRRDHSAIEIRHHQAPASPSESDLPRATLRLHRGTPSNWPNSLITKQV